MNRLQLHTAFLGSMIARPKTVISGIFLLTVLFTIPLCKLSFTSSVYDLIIPGHPTSVAYEAFKTTFGSDDIIQIVLTCDNVFSAESLKTIDRLSQEAFQVPGVARVISLSTIKSDVDVADLCTPETYARMLSPVDLFRGNLISSDKRYTAITVIPDPGGDRDAIIDAIQIRLNQDDRLAGNAYAIGIPLVARALADFTRTDLYSIVPAVFFVILCILAYLFRSVACIVMPVGAVVLSVIWTFGLMAWTGTRVSMLTLIVPVFLLAVGTAYCLHICAEYRTYIRNTHAPAQAVKRTYRHVALPTILAVLTTIAGLVSLLISRIPAIREFAFYSIFGMGSLLFLLMTLFPAGLSLWRLPITPPPQPFLPMTLMGRWLADLQINHRRKILIFACIISVISGVGIFRIQVETNPITFFKDDTPIRQRFNHIANHLSGSFPVHLVLKGPDSDYFDDLNRLRTIDTFKAGLEELPGVDKAICLTDYLKLVNYALNRYDPKFYRMPDEDFELGMLINNFKMVLGIDVLHRFMDPEYYQMDILLLTHLSGSREFLDLADTLKASARTGLTSLKNISWDVTGFGPALSTSSQLLVSQQVKSFGLTLLLIFGLMSLLFLSARVGLISAVTNGFPILVTFGLMGWMGLELSAATCLIASIAIGLAVDDTIHYLVRYNREFKADFNKDRALVDTLHSVGKPIFYTTVTICIGFSLLTASHFVPTAVFGLLMLFTMAAALIGDLFILPALMLHVELVTAWDMLKLMPTLPGLSGGFVHELNEPLNVIRMGSEYIAMTANAESGPDPETLKSLALEISRQVDRASLVIQRLNEMENQNLPQQVPVDLNKAITDTLSILSHQLTLDAISVELDLETALPRFDGHPARIAQVVYNLMQNAREAILSKPSEDVADRRITLTTRTTKGQIQLTIADTGEGIPADLLPRVFEPFFTTRTSGQGKGLGLSINHQIIKAHHGQLKLASPDDQGAIVTVTIPVFPRSQP